MSKHTCISLNSLPIKKIQQRFSQDRRYTRDDESTQQAT